jgi:GxxExxY protein
MDVNRITEQIIGAALAAHRALGPGLPESAYEEGLGRELSLRAVPVERRKPFPAEYKGDVKRMVNNLVEYSAFSAPPRWTSTAFVICFRCL